MSTFLPRTGSSILNLSRPSGSAVKGEGTGEEKEEKTTNCLWSSTSTNRRSCVNSLTLSLCVLFRIRSFSFILSAPWIIVILFCNQSSHYAFMIRGTRHSFPGERAGASIIAHDFPPSSHSLHLWVITILLDVQIYGRRQPASASVPAVDNAERQVSPSCRDFSVHPSIRSRSQVVLPDRLVTQRHLTLHSFHVDQFQNQISTKQMPPGIPARRHLSHSPNTAAAFSTVKDLYMT